MTYDPDYYNVKELLQVKSSLTCHMLQVTTSCNTTIDMLELEDLVILEVLSVNMLVIL